MKKQLLFTLSLLVTWQAHASEIITQDLSIITNKPLGCIISVKTGQSYCLPAGERSDYSLPDWINNQEVYVNTAPGIQVLLSDWDNLSYNRIGTFTGTVETKDLRNVKAWNGEVLDFSHPRSMRVISSKQIYKNCGL